MLKTSSSTRQHTSDLSVRWCSGVDEARGIVAEDPFVVHDVVRPECVEWELVGVNPDAIEASAVIRPEDV